MGIKNVPRKIQVPKGPSLNPADKRLAMMVEDHPFDYKDFEGIISKGNNGAGTVIVWDYGTYEPIEPTKSKKKAEKLLLKQLEAGSVKIVLHGQKVKGEFALVHIKRWEENAWLLIKHKDKYASEKDITLKDKSVVSDEASILWMANMGAIEMNPWNCTIIKPDQPDWCIIDLDPSYDECQLFANIVAEKVHAELPIFTSIERMTNNRKGKIYLDYLQNRPKATLAASYSVRPKPGATVSMPLHWEEVKKGLKMSMFTIRNAVARIRSEGDIFKPVLGKGIDMAKALKE